jgi:hypothetical protein
MMDLGEGSKHSIGVCGAFLIMEEHIKKAFEGMSERRGLCIRSSECPLLKKEWDDSTKH